MEKEFIPYELALRMKQLGFDERTLKAYYKESRQLLDIGSGNMYDTKAPLYQQAFRWFREKGYLISFSSHDTSVHDFYIKWQPSKSILSDTYDTYEEAELACLEKLIDIVEQKQKDI
jgi:hypothetical protein